MFVSFAVENFRSIKDRAELVFTPGSAKNHLVSHIYQNEKMNAGTLRSAGLYGANASGKSNVLMAFEALKLIVVDSGDLKEGKKIPCYEPYRLSSQKKNQPMILEAEFYSQEGNHFFYRVSFKNNEIIEESLDYYPSKVKANLFTRGGEDDWESVKFGAHYKGGVKKIPFFKNNAYISKAGNNAASPEIIKEAYNFFRKDLRHIGMKESIRISTFGDRNEVVDNTAKVLCMVDTGIVGISIKESDSEMPIKLDDDIPQEVIEMIEEDYKYRYMFSHNSEEGEDVVFPKSRESEGTQKLFEVIPLIQSAFKERKVVVVDELDNSLHPHIADLIVKLFNDEDVNRFGSQLIFSTHNMQLMSPEKMRRDQIWFCEKNGGASNLYSLDDFDKKKVKTTTPYATWYDEGRFGGVPDINYQKIATFLSGRDLVEVKDFIVEDNGFFEEYIGDEITGEGHVKG